MATTHETLVVYDFDGDTTVPVIARLADELPAVRGLLNERGRGVLQAMLAGIDAARGEFVLISMADGSDEPQVIDSMVALARAGLTWSPAADTCRAAARSADRGSSRSSAGWRVYRSTD